MAEAGKSLDSLRFDRREVTRLVIVLAFSLGIHLIGIGGYELSRQFHLFPWLHWMLRPQPVARQLPQAEPVEFAWTPNPSREAPKNARYYGAQNSVAADNTRGHEDQAKLDGTQKEVPNPNTGQQNTLMPTSPQPVEPQPVVQPGDFVLGQPQPQQQERRPQKLSQVLPAGYPQPVMNRPGGAPRLALVPSLDVKGSPFGAYDEKLIDAIRQRWFDLLTSRQFALDRQGKVAVHFRLNYDGTVSDVSVTENTVGALLGQVCEDAVHDPAPFQAWTDEMRHQFGLSRDVTFVFYY